MTEEIWKPLPNIPAYIVSSKGRVAHVLRGKLQHGYTLFELPDPLSKKRKRKSMFAHRAVALAFHGLPPLPKMDAAHHDGDKANNTPENIRWKTRRENMLDKRRHGKQPFNETHHWAKINMATANEIRRRFATGLFTKVGLGKKFKVSKSTIRRIVNSEARGGWRKEYEVT